METKSLGSWEEFEKDFNLKLKFIEECRNKKKGFFIPDVLFRGQSDAAWSLKTTLDRAKPKVSYVDYYSLIRRIKSRVETATDKTWQLRDYKDPEIDMWLVPIGLDFMVYLRHHGFPSPLLDWTRSPYIAAYFAFNNIEESKEVAIFVYISEIGEGKTATGDNPTISHIGPNITAHRRHYLQQCEYTICTKKQDKVITYWDHEEVFSKNDSRQDLLTKYIFPASAKNKVLKKLDLMNINAYSLFDTPEALMETLAIRNLFIEE